MFWNTETETSGPVKSERPGWLANDAENPSGKDWDTSEPAVSSEPTVDLSPTSTSGSTTGRSSGGKSPWCMRFMVIVLSLILMAAFIYSAIAQKKGGRKIEWYIFYSISAAIPAFFLCQYIICFPPKIISLLTAGMAIWSTVYIILIAVKVSHTTKGGAHDSQGRTKREEYIWELAGSSVGLASALYHACASRYCVSVEKIKDVE